MATVTQWTAATNKFTANFNGSVSFSAGYMGGDGTTTIDLGSGRVLWLFGDTFWATAAGQTRAQCQFLRNSVAIQDGYDLSSATMTHYAGTPLTGSDASAVSFFPELPPCNYQWPNAGVLLDDKLIVTSGLIQGGGNTTGLDFLVEGWRAYIIDNPTAAPSSWNMTLLPVPSWNDDIMFTVGMTDLGDGYVYVFGRGSDFDLYVLRWDRAQAKAGNLMDPEYYYGATLGWRKNTALGRTKIRMKAVSDQSAALGANDGSMHKRSDGTWINVQTPSFGQTHLASCEASSLEGPFTPLVDFYVPPEASADNGSGQPRYNIYAGKAHPEQTWSGKATDDVMVSYVAAAANVNVYTDMTTYYPRILQVSGL